MLGCLSLSHSSESPCISGVAFHPTSSHCTNVQDRYSQFHSQARFFGDLAYVLLEFYYCEGPACLLDLVMELSQVHLNLLVLSNDLRKGLGTVQLADAFLAVYELKHDSNTTAVTCDLR
jgi:hypothetical protein